MTGEVIATVVHGKRKTLDNTDGVLVYQITENRKGRMVNAILTNRSSAQHVRIYDACSSEESGLRLDVMVGATDTKILDKDDLLGVEEFYSGVFAACEVSGDVWLSVGVEEY